MTTKQHAAAALALLDAQSQIMRLDGNTFCFRFTRGLAVNTSARVPRGSKVLPLSSIQGAPLFPPPGR